MYLQSLELAGFKSFAKKTTLTFTTSITAIVGPNGSGKSNIAEAFRFVLGEQSLKTMRGKRTEDLIWNGSKTVARSSKASVTLTFENAKTKRGGKLFDIDFDRVGLSRVIHRDASSEYLLNNSPVRLRDTVELLAGAHIGSSGAHIISQGEADRVLAVNTRERKQMIEDALGLTVYEYKLEASRKKLERTQENIAQVEGLRKEIAPHLKFLKRQVEKLEKVRELQDELTDCYREYFAREERYVTTERNALELRRAPLASRREELQRLLARAKETLASAERADASSKAVVTLETELSKARDAKDALTRGLALIEGQLAAVESAIKRLETKQVKDAGATVPFSDVKNIVATVGAHIERADHATELSTVREVIAAIRDILETFVSRAGDAAKKGSDELTDLMSERDRLQGERQTLAEKLEASGVNERKIAEKYRTLRTEVESARDTTRTAEREVFSRSSELQEVRVGLTDVEGKLERLALERDEFERERAEAKALAGDAAVSYADVSLGGSAGAEPRSAQESRKKHIEKLKVRVEDAGGGGGDEMLKEYQELSERENYLSRELDDLQRSAVSLMSLIDELSEKLRSDFAAGLGSINREFERFFKLMFGGGAASLFLVKERRQRRKLSDLVLAESVGELEGSTADAEADEELTEGVDVSVSLPHKRIKGLQMLSGGERALTSIAILFAMSSVNPPPFVILDETDAALDEANSRKYGDMIEALSKQSQLILITHNRETMSRAGVLYGVTMAGDGVSQLLSVGFEEAVAVAK